MNARELPSYAIGLAVAFATWSITQARMWVDFDPSRLGAMLFVRPAELLPVTIAAYGALGVLIGIASVAAPTIEPARVVVAATVASAIWSFLPSLYGAGVMGFGWWVIGLLLSGTLMLVGAQLTMRAARVARRRR